ncbi:hypothetical protein D3C81_1425290 [compost metagenome]
MLRPRQSQCFKKGRQCIDGFRQSIFHRAARDIRRRPRITHDQRHAHRLLQQKLLLAQPVITEKVAVIAGEHDQCVIPATVALQKVEQPSELIIHLLDQTHVRRDYSQSY